MYRVMGLMASALLPFSASAQSAPGTFREFGDLVVQILKGITGIIFMSLVVGLIYGVMLYLMNADNEQKRSEIKSYLLWGVIGITVVFSLWGILSLLCNTLSWCNAGIPHITPPA